MSGETGSRDMVGGVSRQQMEEVTCGFHVRLCAERERESTAV